MSTYTTDEYDLVTDRICGRCGVRRDLHPRSTCAKPRLSWWWDRHYAHLHVALAVWRRLPSRARWSVAAWFTEKRGRDWCQTVDSVTYADHWDDWALDYTPPDGCGCDFPFPWQAGPPRYGECYCTPADDRRTTERG